MTQALADAHQPSAWDEITGRMAPVQQRMPAVSSPAWQPPRLPAGLQGMLDTDSRYWPATLPPKAARASLELAARAYQAGIQPASPEAIDEVLLALSIVFRTNSIAPAEAEALFKLYERHLSDLPADLLVKAVDRAHRHCRFFPKPAELRAFVEDDMIDRRQKAARARLLLERMDGARP